MRDWIPDIIFGIVGLLLGGLLGPAFGFLAESPKEKATFQEVHTTARKRSGHQTSFRTRPQRPQSLSNDNDGIIVAFFIFLVVIALYLKWRPYVIILLLSLAITILALSSCVVLIASRRGVVAGSRIVWAAQVSPIIITSAGVIDGIMLWEGVGAPPEVRSALVQCSIQPLQGRPEGLLWIGYTLIGAFLFTGVGLTSIYFGLANIWAIYVAANARGSWLWRRLYRLQPYDGNGKVTVALTTVAILTIAFCSGLIFEGLSHLSHTSV